MSSENQENQPNQVTSPKASSEKTSRHKPYRCRLCPQRFGFRSLREEHEKMHKDPELKCVLCSKLFRLKGNLKKHFQLHFLREDEFQKAWESYIDDESNANAKNNGPTSTQVDTKPVLKDLKKNRAADSRRSSIEPKPKKAKPNLAKESNSKSTRCCKLKDLRYGTSNRFCMAEECRIPPGAKYMCPKKEMDDEVQNYCLKCFEDADLNVNDWEEKENTNPALEEIDECGICKRLFHRVCELNIRSKSSFICKKCSPRRVFNMMRRVGTVNEDECAKFMARKLNEFILQNNRQKKHQIPVTVVSFTKMKEVVTSEMCPELDASDFIQKYSETVKFVYRAIYAYHMIDGIDVPFFSMFVTEYPSHAGQSWCTINYLDTVPYFESKGIKRGAMHGEIILTYIDYMKSIGYENAHIWSNPPNQGDDFIFNIHPDYQTFLGQNGLNDWYIRILQKGKEDGIIQSYKTFEEKMKENVFKSMVDIPIFPDSLWSNVMKETNMETSNKNTFKKKMQANYKKHAVDNFWLKLNEPSGSEPAIPTLFPHPIMGDQETFMDKCAEMNLEFSTLRRAKFSSVSLIKLMYDADYF
ncbi:hypothetical protein GCK72_008112 [Caenorhabditis remanei]|uniref:histone acetyltransferase n=1 Tax=Caenorhabditis remanei TaxID=31234 RepID=A0A6A5HJ02_CAERE|nr:hypothetical protein GCK72_008112 [Caenorhabditis remanei]KAF1768150.1 hypothetical protein GCK72_008112 [Caenorhabditis remanei]